MLYDFLRKYPVIEFWLFDRGGSEIFYSRSDCDDFIAFAGLAFSLSARCVMQAKQKGLEISESMVKRILEMTELIEGNCRELKSSLAEGLESRRHEN
jgi:hypothetical protein